jgi:hypothetical protein
MLDIGQNFSPMVVGDVEVIAVDFGPSQTLAAGETIASADWTVTYADGTPAPNDMLVTGAQSIAGNVCATYIKASAAGVFVPRCRATTSTGQQITLPDPGRGLLKVVN